MKIKKKLQQLSLEEIDRIIEMAWEDRTTFEAIKKQFGLGPYVSTGRKISPSRPILWTVSLGQRKIKLSC